VAPAWPRRQQQPQVQWSTRRPRPPSKPTSKPPIECSTRRCIGTRRMVFRSCCAVRPPRPWSSTYRSTCRATSPAPKSSCHKPTSTTRRSRWNEGTRRRCRPTLGCTTPMGTTTSLGRTCARYRIRHRHPPMRARHPRWWWGSALLKQASEHVRDTLRGQAERWVKISVTAYRTLRAVVVVGLDDLVVDAAGGRRACRGTRVDLRGLVCVVQRCRVGAVDRPAVLRSGTRA
jgi:hypothetical protein